LIVDIKKEKKKKKKKKRKEISKTSVHSSHHHKSFHKKKFLGISYQIKIDEEKPSIFLVIRRSLKLIRVKIMSTIHWDIND